MQIVISEKTTVTKNIFFVIALYISLELSYLLNIPYILQLIELNEKEEQSFPKMSYRFTNYDEIDLQAPGTIYGQYEIC